MSEDRFFFPASFAQQRLWFLDQLMPGNPFYNIATGLPLNFRLNVATFERSLNEIIRRHEILRTSFTTVDGEPFQTVIPDLKLTVDVVDLEAVSPIERSQELQRLATAEAVRP